MAEITVKTPDNVSYKKPESVDLSGAKSLQVAQAQGGGYKVAVGGSLRANQTSMGMLANSLKGVNQALTMYADIAVKREERGLDEIRRMSNEKKRELIGAENKQFRKMGIRPQSILQVKHSLGTAESGKFQGEWQQHLDNTLIPNQSSGGNPLSSKQIQQEYIKFRQGWANSNEFLKQSQLATDGFLADTDGLYDRNSAYYFKSADSYYEQNVQRFSAVEALYSTASNDPENIAKVAKEIFSSMDATTTISTLKDLSTKAIQSGDISAMETAQRVIGTMASPENNIKIGNQRFSETATFELMSIGLKRKKEEAEYSGLVRSSNELKLEDEKLKRQVDEHFAQYQVDMKNATTDAERKNLTTSHWQAAQEMFEPVGEKMALDLMNTLENSIIDLTSKRQGAQTKADVENTTSLLAPVQNAIYKLVPSEETTAEINDIVEKQKKELDEMERNGTLSARAAQETKGKLHALGNATSQNNLRLSKVDELSRSTQNPDRDIRLTALGNNQKALLREAKELMIGADGKKIGQGRRASNLELAPALGDTSQYRTNLSQLNDATETLFTDLLVDYQSERQRLSLEAFNIYSPTQGGTLSIDMRTHVETGMKAYEEIRNKEAVTALVDIHNSAEKKARLAEIRNAGYSIENEISDFELNERYEAFTAWEKSVEAGNDDMFYTNRDARTGEISLSIGADAAIDLNDSEPFSGNLKEKHLQYKQRVELLRNPKTITSGPDRNTNSAFDILDDESRSRLSSHYSQILNLVDPLTQEKLIDTLLLNVDRGQIEYFDMGGRFGIGMQNSRALSRDASTIQGIMLNTGGAAPQFAEQTYEGRRKAIGKVLTAYKNSSVPVEHWMDEKYGGNSSFSLSGADGDVKSGLGYQNRKDLSFVPVETIQKLYNFVGSDEATGNIRADLGTALASLPADDIKIVKAALKKFYITEDVTPEQALSQLFINHRAIYSVNQGYSFDQ